jgi:TRAP-type C4-dicarboxylate transport system permease small subunit
MQRIERGIILICQTLMWITTVLIFVILCANTILRYATGSSLQWAAEVPELLFPWLVTAGIVLAAAHGSHITTTFMMARLSSAKQRIVSVIVWLLVAGLYATLAVATGRMIEIVHDEASPILGIPGSVSYGCILVGMVMLAVLALQAAWRVWTLGVQVASIDSESHVVSIT